MHGQLAGGSSRHTEQVWGAKLWFFVPPEHARFTNEHPLAWLARQVSREAGDGVAFQVALQRPGDTVYIPEHWSHAVINLANSVAVAMEEHL